MTCAASYFTLTITPDLEKCKQYWNNPDGPYGWKSLHFPKGGPKTQRLSLTQALKEIQYYSAVAAKFEMVPSESKGQDPSRCTKRS